SAEFVDCGIEKQAENPDRFAITCPWQDNSGKNQDYNDLPPQHLWLERGKWYSIEVAHYTDPSNAGTKLWIDGHLVLDHTGHSMTSWKVDSVWLGTCIKDSGITGTLYFDDFVMSTSYIGP
nr:hypothetical protein [Anaerolineales bacterium]